MKKLIKIVIILIIIFGPPVYGYFWLMNRMEKNQVAEQARIDAEKIKNEEVDKNEDLAKQQRAEKEKADAYMACLNKAHIEYQAKYDEECSKYIMDGQCQVSQDKLYEIQGIYMFDKKQCEKLKQ